MSSPPPPTTEPRLPPVPALQHLAGLFNARRYSEMEAHASVLAERFPDSGDAWKALGVALQCQGKDALAALQRAVDLLPDDADGLSNLGSLLSDRGRLGEAIACFNRALQLRPGHASACNNLGLALARSGQLDAAVDSYRRALALRADFTEAHFNLANALKGLWQMHDAAASYRQVLLRQPRHALALARLGAVLTVLGQVEDARSCLVQAIDLRPDLVDAHIDLGVAWMALDRPDQAAACQRRAIELQPERALAHANLGHALKELGELEQAESSYRRALVLAPEDLTIHSDHLLLQHFMADIPAARRLDDARAFAGVACGRARPFTAWRGEPDPGKCLRVGLLSGDLRQHPVGYFCESVLAALARRAAGRIEVWAYASHAVSPGPEDGTSERIRASVHRWVPVSGLSDEALARRIHDDGIDVLLDLSGHTALNRLPVLAWKPAPVLASWLGCCATTGLDEVDWFIVDPWIAPPGAEAQFTEKLLRLPESFLCFTPPPLQAAVAPLPALANGHVTFGCFNSTVKLNDAVLALWARVLKAVPGSRLMLKARQLGSDIARERLSERMARFGIPAGRLRLEAASPRAEYLAAHSQVDILLDPFPYPGGTTSVEGLWMGVPVLTWPVEAALSRQGASLLNNLGMTDWIADGADDFVARAARHTADLPALAGLRSGLRARLMASPLGDADRFAAHFEQALRAMWQARAC
jgi:predicted O-linked N-acetylglucosamine transferase (SPINDLY family)